MLSDDLGSIADTLWAYHTTGHQPTLDDLVAMETCLRDLAEQVGALEDSLVPDSERLSEASLETVASLARIATAANVDRSGREDEL